MEAQPIDPLAAIKAELWRWHLGRVLVHQFWLMARRVQPERAVKSGWHGGDGSAGRAREKKAAGLGLAAVKHQQAQERRAAITDSFQAAERAALIEAATVRPPGLGNKDSGRGPRRKAYRGKAAHR